MWWHDAEMAHCPLGVRLLLTIVGYLWGIRMEVVATEAFPLVKGL